MKMKKYLNIFAVLLLSMALLCGCGDEAAVDYTYSPNVGFGDVFYEFTDIRAASNGLLSSALDPSWWNAFYSIKDNVSAADLAAKSINDAERLSSADAALCPVLSEVLSAYASAFDIMSASGTSADPEIAAYAMKAFKEKITDANSHWDAALSAAAAAQTAAVTP